MATTSAISHFAILSLRAALSLEVRGMKRSRRPSAYAIVKNAYGFKGSKTEVLRQFDEWIKVNVRLPFQRGVKGDT